MNNNAFTPGVTVSIAGTTTTARAAITGIGTTIEIQNTGTTTIFVNLGNSTVTAAVTDYPVLGGQSKMITRGDPASYTHIAAITGTGTATVYVTAGEGA